jgi:F420-dependent oxidoreductase-like protein
MNIGLSLGQGSPLNDSIALGCEADRLGYDSVWAAEAWGADAVTPLAWLGSRTSRIKLGTAVMQIPARTPVNAAMTAATLDLLSGGRFQLGLGNSGPQVVEGWHGQPWGKPLQKMREYVEVVRATLRRETIVHHGSHYDIPVTAGTGLAKPLRLSIEPERSSLPIFLGVIAPKAVELAFEIADGWLPIFLVPERAGDVFPLDRARSSFQIAPTVRVAIGDVQLARDSLKEYYAFYVGGMGARSRNFYNDLFVRLGYEQEAERIQTLFLEGRRKDAAATVPDRFVDEVALVGPPERIRDRLEAWKESGVTSLLLAIRDIATLRTVAQIAL